jgi:hypothetical protein
MTFTPGPWKAVPDSGSESFAFEIATERMEGVALIYAYDTPSEANARLIAAAPELLEALRQALAVVDAVADGRAEDVVELAKRIASDVVDAAIAKAEGRSP